MNALIPLEKFSEILDEMGPAFKAEFNKRSKADLEANWYEIQDGVAEDSVVRKNKILSEMKAELAAGNLKKAA